MLITSSARDKRSSPLKLCLIGHNAYVCRTFTVNSAPSRKCHTNVNTQYRKYIKTLLSQSITTFKNRLYSLTIFKKCFRQIIQSLFFKYTQKHEAFLWHLFRLSAGRWHIAKGTLAATRMTIERSRHSARPDDFERPLIQSVASHRISMNQQHRSQP